ncbi:hypothetical protein HUJ04_004755 [Dendroctonus ponderosae]|nr:hypothetical protein HUJ04_004755 [Dendroctonus ponderosae]KAH1007535.1 hypothetical protein HUJ04_004755 [Dendroctonus ponderosae]
MEPITESARKESCLSCKLISIGCLTGIGSYLVATSIRSYKGKSRAFIGALGADQSPNQFLEKEMVYPGKQEVVNAMLERPALKRHLADKLETPFNED